MFEGDWYEKWKATVTGFPDETQCPKCNGFAITDKVIDLIIETSGGNDYLVRMRLEAARCTCRPPHRVNVEQGRLPYKET